jgi:hypothetical protein
MEMRPLISAARVERSQILASQAPMIAAFCSSIFRSVTTRLNSTESISPEAL